MSATAWKPEFGLWDAPKAVWTKLAPEDTAELLACGAELPPCRTCGDTLTPGGPNRVFVDQDGVLAGAYCARCVIASIERRRQEALQVTILERAPKKGRSKGLLSNELMAEGFRLGDIRLALEELLANGRLTQYRQFVKRTKPQCAQEALL
jgi:hypothetical protein